MPKVRKAELSFLYVTHHLVLFYISTKYHKNISKGYSSYRTDNKFYADADTDTSQQDPSQKQYVALAPFIGGAGWT